MEFNGPSGKLRIVLLFLVGLGTLGYGVYSYDAQTSALDSAVEVNATITSVSVEKDTAGKGIEYVPHATFSYTYEGATYTSSKVYPGKLPKDFGTKDAARSEVGEFEPGEAVTAYVPPNSPGNAFLKSESSNKPLFVMGFGVLFVLGSGYSALKELFR